MASGSVVTRPSGRRTNYFRTSNNSMFPQKDVAPKPTEVPDTYEESTQAGNLPNASLGGIVAEVIGRKRIPEANTIWTGNLRPLVETFVTQTETQEQLKREWDQPGFSVVDTTQITTTTVTTVATVGYLVDIHMAVCLGPNVRLHAIYVDNEPIWTGNVGPNRTVVNVSQNDTFLTGTEVIFSGGAYDQAPEPDVAAFVTDYPGYVGVATVLIKGARADMPMGSLSFEVSRFPNPLELSSGDNVVGEDLNVINAMVEVMTNPWGWGGLDIANFDVTRLKQLAAVTKSETNFASVKITNETSVAAIVKILQEQAAAIIFQDPQTGLITGNLIRESNIDYATMSKFSPRNVMEIQAFEKTGWQNTIEQARGLYTERDAAYNEVPVFVQNPANLSQSGRGRRTASLYYPYVSNRTLASSLLKRDMALLGAPLYSTTILANREAADKLPGDIVSLSWPDFGLLNEPVLVLKVRKHPLNVNQVSLQVRQMKLPDVLPLFGPGGGGFNPGFDVAPKTPTSMVVLSAPYFMARARAGISSLTATPIALPMFLPLPANSFQFSFNAVLKNKPDASGDVTVINQGPYATYGRLTAAIDKFDNYGDGIIPSITIGNIVNPVNLVSVGNVGVRAGQLFLVIDNEILSFESAVDNNNGTWTLTNVHRGLLDTVAQSHALNANCFILTNNFNYVSGLTFNYPLGYTPEWLVTSNTITRNGQAQDGLTYSGWAPSNVRVLSPPRVHDLQVDSVRSSTPVALTIGNSVTVSWKRRSRVSSVVALQDDASEPGEVTDIVQTHNVKIRASNNVVHTIDTTVDDTLTFNLPAMATGAGEVFVETEIKLAGTTYKNIYEERAPVVIS